MEPKSDYQRVGELLVVLGAIVSLFFGVLHLLNFGAWVSFLPSVDLGSLLGAFENIGRGLILLVVSMVTLATSGTIDIPALQLEKNWLVLIVLSALMYIFGGTLGGILVFIGAIMMLL
jgi:hypothetical protein